MKIRFLLLLIIFISAFNVFGEKKEQDAKKEKEVHSILEKKSNNLKPLSDMCGESLKVDCYWEEGVIEVDFSESEGMGSISFYEITGKELYKMDINTQYPIIINIGYPDEPVLIRIRTSMGNEYEGILIL
ncbi:MAG: hypothetical protein HFJ95_05130 [Muribaculaceae bacterium]|nr:hypothetical protein [Muribaculaceae bacterium]